MNDNIKYVYTDSLLSQWKQIATKFNVFFLNVKFLYTSIPLAHPGLVLLCNVIACVGYIKSFVNVSDVKSAETIHVFINCKFLIWT